MNELKYFLAKLHKKLMHGDKEIISNYFRKAGMKIGKNCNICCNIMTAEPYMIEIGNNVTISGNVVFVTHDNSVAKLFGGVRPIRQDYYWKQLLYWSELNNYVWCNAG